MDEIQRLLSNTGDGAWAVDKEQRIIFWNKALEKMVGRRAEEVIGQNCYQVLAGQTPDGQPCCLRRCGAINQTRQGNPIDSTDRIVRHGDGRSLLVNVSTVFVSDNDQANTPISIIHLARPVNEHPAPSSKLYIHLLGPTLVNRNDGFQVQGPLWQRTKVRGLLAFLAIQRGQYVHRAQIVETLWPNKPHAAALHNLNTAVYYLRRCLEPNLQRGAKSQYIHYKSNRYRLYGDAPHWLDVNAFEMGIKYAHRESDLERAIDGYQTALRLYRGDFLTDMDTSVNWHEGEQIRLRELYLSALEDLGYLFERQGKEENANQQYQKALAVNPCQETACRQLMRLALQRGRPAAAAAHYQRLTKALQTELNIYPDEETRRLYEKVRNGR